MWIKGGLWLILIALLFTFCISGVESVCKSVGDKSVCHNEEDTKVPSFRNNKTTFSLQFNSYVRITDKTFPVGTKLIVIDQDVPFHVDDNAFGRIKTSLETLFLKGITYDFGDRCVPVDGLTSLKTLGLTVASAGSSSREQVIDDIMKEVYDRLDLSDVYVVGGGQSKAHGDQRNFNMGFIVDNDFLDPLVARELKSLYLVGNAIFDISPGAFKEFTKLQSLYLSDNLLKEIPQSVQALIGEGTLKELDVDYNVIVTVRSEFFRQSCKLTYVNFASNRIESIDTDAFGNCLDLQTVILSNNPRLVCIPPQTFNFILMRPEELSLHLDNTSIATLEFVKDLDNLKLFMNDTTNLACSCELEGLIQTRGTKLVESCHWGPEKLYTDSKRLKYLWEKDGCESAPLLIKPSLLVDTPCEISINNEIAAGDSNMELGAMGDEGIVPNNVSTVATDVDKGPKSIATTTSASKAPAIHTGTTTDKAKPTQAQASKSLGPRTDAGLAITLVSCVLAYAASSW